MDDDDNVFQEGGSGTDLFFTSEYEAADQDHEMFKTADIDDILRSYDPEIFIQSTIKQEVVVSSSQEVAISIINQPQPGAISTLKEERDTETLLAIPEIPIQIATTSNETNGNGNGNDSRNEDRRSKLIDSINKEWNEIELQILSDAIKRYDAEPSNFQRYAKIAAMLPHKTIRDVAYKYQLVMKVQKNGAGKKSLNPGERDTKYSSPQLANIRVENDAGPSISNNVHQQLIEENNLLLCEWTNHFSQYLTVESIKNIDAIKRRLKENYQKLLSGTEYWNGVNKMPNFTEETQENT